MTANNRASLDAVVAFSLISEATGAAPLNTNVPLADATDGEILQIALQVSAPRIFPLSPSHSPG